MSPDFEPFSVELIPDLIKYQKDEGKLHVTTRESSSKEFKESFTWGSIGLYARTMAAFANARGGYIFFGVTDKPRVAIGLTGQSKAAFDNLDQAKLTEGLNELFSPEIQWQFAMFDVGGVTIGALYTYESENKPVVAKKSYQPQNAKVVEGDIVYRYNSRSERAKYPEVKKILDEAKVKESKAMMSHIEELVKAGASNAAVLDFGKSTLRGAGGETVLIDEELLKKISFIKEGEFSEVAGAPTLKLVGELQGARTIAIGPERIVRTALGTEDVITDFLEQTHIGNPDDYLRQAVRSTIAYLPMQFYRQLAELTHEDLKTFVEGVTTRAQAKAKILKRLETGDPMRIKTPSTTSGADSTKRRRAFYEELSNRTVPSVSDPRQAQFLMDAVQSLDDDQIQDIFEELLPEMRRLFDEYYASDAKFADALRRACCRVDIALYGADTDTN